MAHKWDAVNEAFDRLIVKYEEASMKMEREEIRDLAEEERRHGPYGGYMVMRPGRVHATIIIGGKATHIEESDLADVSADEWERRLAPDGGKGTA